MQSFGAKSGYAAGEMKAAARNHAQAQFALGVLYSSGSGTAKDNIAAHM
jgi:TPR repeat protein